jgi:hypothetical protein
MTALLQAFRRIFLEGQVNRDLVFRMAPGFLAAFFLFYGPEFVELRPNHALHVNPFAPLEPDYQYLHNSILGPFLGHALSLHRVFEIIALYLAATVLAAGAMLLYVRQRWDDPDARGAAFLIISLSPVWYVLTGYVGNSSSLLVLLYVLLLLAPQAVVAWMWALLLVLAHREIGVSVLGLHILLRKPDGMRTAALVVGAAAGLGLHQLYMSHLEGEVSARGSFVLVHWKMWIKLNLLKPVTLVLMAFNWFWAAVLFAAWRELLRWRDAAAILVAIGLSAVTIDTTRVAMLVGLPLIFSLSERIVADYEWRRVRCWPLWAAIAFLQFERYAWQTLQIDEVNWDGTFSFLWKSIWSHP